MKAGKSYSDGELIEAISRRESLERPVRYLYELHFDNLTHFIKKNKGSQQDAEDLFQELILVFIDLVQTGKFRGQSSIKTFLYAIARNLWLNELKKRERVFLRDTEYYKISPQEEEAIQAGLVKNESKKQVLSLLDGLGETCRKILVHYYYDDLSMKEIFERMDYESEQVVRNKKYKCMKQLTQMLENNSTVKNSLKDFLVHGI
ncbi:MAG TPA: RNA polymerase sigma factor [Cytophagales bacterium]